MATVTTTTNNLRYTFGMRNGDTRYLDIENPTTDASVISANVSSLNTKIGSGSYAGILVGQDYYNGDTDAVVVGINKAEVIKITKTTETTSMFSN